MRGHRAAFTRLVQLHDRNLRALAYRLMGSAQEMDDLLQEVYLKAYRAYPGFRGDASAATWLYRIAYNACMDRLRQCRTRPEVSLDALAEEGGDGARAMGAGGDTDPADLVSVRRDLAGALALLPPEQKTAVLLVDAVGLDYKSAAEIMGVRSGTLASRLHAARTALRAALAD